MFHVEPGDIGCVVQRRRGLGGGDEYLRGPGLQPVQNPGLVVAIQFGGQVVQCDHRPFAALLGVVLGWANRQVNAVSLAWPRDKASRPGMLAKPTLQSARCGPTEV